MEMQEKYIYDKSAHYPKITSRNLSNKTDKMRQQSNIIVLFITGCFVVAAVS